MKEENIRFLYIFNHLEMLQNWQLTICASKIIYKIIGYPAIMLRVPSLKFFWISTLSNTIFLTVKFENARRFDVVLGLYDMSLIQTWQKILFDYNNELWKHLYNYLKFHLWSKRTSYHPWWAWRTKKEICIAVFMFVQWMMVKGSILNCKIMPNDR